MSVRAASSIEGAPLQCLDGRASPPGFARDLRLVLRLPPSAREHFWDALLPALEEPLPPPVEAFLDRFCSAFDVDKDDLARALKACRFLVREASARDFDRARLAEDIARLFGPSDALDAASLAALLLDRYDAAKARVRAGIARATLADHGKLVEGIDWCVQRIEASSRGAKLSIPLAAFTIGYREGERRDRITLHLSRETVEALRQACEKILA